MELVNLGIIVACSLILMIWALKKRVEIKTLRVELLVSDEDYMDKETERLQKRMTYDGDRAILTQISNYFQEMTVHALHKIRNYVFYLVVLASIGVWLVLEQTRQEYAQAIFFFIGAFSQVLIGLFIFKKYNFYDPRVIFLARISKWHATDFAIKINAYITLMNQALNLIFFAATYYISTYILIGRLNEGKKSKDFEKFHRRFMAYGFGSNFVFFLVKSLCNLTCMGTKMTYEILGRQELGIPVDHPKNGARILNNISEGFFRTLHNLMEFNAFTNMGLCLFQDFFVIKPVYILHRGYLNAVSVYSLGMVSSLIAMAYFRRRNKFKVSEMKEYDQNFKKMKYTGYSTIWISAILTMLGTYFVFWNTFPDLIDVFNPFKANLALQGIDYKIGFGIFSLAFLLVLVLVRNSLKYTGPKSEAFRSIQEFSKVSFSLNLIKSDYFASYATIAPVLAFFVIILVAYQYGNAFGVCLTYLGAITFSQIMQFFQNFQNMPYYYIGMLMSSKPKGDADDDEQLDVPEHLNDNFADLMHFCRYYGKFSTGVSLFIHKVMCFAILLDSFNMHIVDHINLIEPYNLMAIMVGCMGIQVFVSLDHVCATKYVKFFLHRIHQTLVKKDIDDPSYQPPVDELNKDLLAAGFMSQFLLLYLPTFIFFGAAFFLFGNKTINIVLYGAFLWMMLTAYKKKIKVDLLKEEKSIWKSMEVKNLYKGVDPKSVKGLTGSIGSIYQNYGSDPLEKIVVLSCCLLACSQFMITKKDYLDIGMQKFSDLLFK